jgi:hypothetical protein
MKKITKIFTSVALTLVLTAPSFFALAAVTTFKDLINTTIIGGILRPLVPLLIGLAIVMFTYGVLVFMFSEGGEKKEEGKQYMLWGIIGIFVMVSVWGIVAAIKNTFNLSDTPLNIQL